MDPNLCPRCGNPVTVKSRGRPARWCSDRCRKLASEERRAGERGAIGLQIRDHTRVVEKPVPERMSATVAAARAAEDIDAALSVLSALQRRLVADEVALTDLDREIQASVLDAQVIEVSKGLPREVADLRIVPFALELGDHDDGEDDRVLGEPEERLRIAQQDRGVEDIGAQILIRIGGRCSPRGLTGGLLRGACGLLRCTCGHDPLPTRVIPAIRTSRPGGHESST